MALTKFAPRREAYCIMGLYFEIKKLMDMDYWHKLSEEDKAWLKKFNSEYYYGYFNTKDFARRKPNVHKTKGQRKRARKEVKDRSKDLWMRSKKGGTKPNE